MKPIELSMCSVSLGTFDRLKFYSKSSLFRKCIQYIIAYRCPINEEEVARYRKIFFKIDSEYNGQVTPENM
jgi:hypothetical protein